MNHSHTALQTLLDRCVHCGFCNATCPTYQLSGDENDGPRGRIYRVGTLLEADTPVSEHSRTYLENCLQCRNCETTCPSGVEYSQILHRGLEQLAWQQPRSKLEQLKRHAFGYFLSQRVLFGFALACGQALRGVLPHALQQAIPPKSPHKLPAAAALGSPSARILLLRGCVQPSLSPNTDKALALLLQQHGIALDTLAVSSICCGAAAGHLHGEATAKQQAKRLLDAVAKHWDKVDGVVMSASGCLAHLREYPALFDRHVKDERDYHRLALELRRKLRDPIDLLEPLRFALKPEAIQRKIAFHAPCTARNSLKTATRIEQYLRQQGYALVPVDNPLCCGSAGVQSVLKPHIGQPLRTLALSALTQAQPEVILSANVGCQAHLGAASMVPVRHYLEQLALDSR